MSKRVAKKNKPPMYVSISFDGVTTEQLKKILETELGADVVEQYPVRRGLNDVAHMTLIFNRGISGYKDIIETEYLNLEGTRAAIKISGFTRDRHCVALNVSTTLPVYPKDKHQHVTMMLNGRNPVYSNELIERMRSQGGTVRSDERAVVFDEPVEVEGVVVFHFPT